MTAPRHPSVIAPADAPCPFCGSGGVALRALAPKRQTRRVKSTRYVPCACAFCAAGRALSARPGHSAHTVGQLVAHFDYLGGTCAAIQRDAFTMSPAYQEHIDAGERPVADVAGGGYRWEKPSTTQAA